MYSENSAEHGLSKGDMSDSVNAHEEKLLRNEVSNTNDYFDLSFFALVVVIN